MLLALFGCSSPAETPPDACTSFEDVRVVDAAGVADASDLDEIEGILARMKEWTGLDGVCVPEIRLVSEEQMADAGHPDAEGVYLGPGQPILVRSAGIAHHEVCHAVDQALGWPSRERPDLFGEDDPVEGFAVACADGPEGVALAEAFGAACGADFVDPATRFLRERAYVRWEEPDLAARADGAPPGDVTLAIPLDPLADVVEVAGSGARVHAVAQGGDVLYAVDPDTGLLVGTLALPAPGDGEEWDLVSGDAGVLLVRRGETQDAWWIGDDGGALAEVTLPPLHPEQYLTGAVREGRALFSTRSADEATGWPSWHGVDLADGAAEIGEPDGRIFYGAFSDGAGLTAVATHAWTDVGARVVRLDEEGGIEDVLAVDWGIVSAANLPDGTLLAKARVGAGSAARRAWLVGEPEAGRWALLSPDCDDEGAWDRLVQVGGRAYVLRFDAGRWTASAAL